MTPNPIVPNSIKALLAGAVFGLSASAIAQTYTTEHHSFQLETVVSGLSNPWSLAFLPNDEILITERPGRLRRMVEGSLIDEPVSGLPEITASGQGGLLDVVPHPDFAQNRWVYFSYSHGNNQGLTTRLARGQYHDGHLSNVEILFDAAPRVSGGRHFGSRIVFDDDGYLYLTVGDRGQQNRAQELDNHIGTTIRLHDDGQVPSDNPFVDHANALPEIYTYGNRNAQGMALHPSSRAVWQHEHGPRGGDEINLIQSGLNYGWPEVTHGINYNGSPITDLTEKAGMESPLLHWTPSIAPSGMAFYTGDVFPQWEGDLFVGALAGQKIQRVRFNGTDLISQEDMLTGFNTRIRDIRNGPDGTLWLLTDEGNGRLLRMVPAP
ncbi:PQQ-dependent sugar dehydrogenase [Salinispirillum sp. LH 10-3-1]|uniref:PQQ-dependent sugar dehydrogenase n=1 Tax=Salinispirillum sp. LH 10-3-1 TaxID=2952525 RepID=A0AB38YCN3_9GAMM